MGWHSWDEVLDGWAQPGSPVSVVARKPNHLDLFVTDKDGRIRTTWSAVEVEGESQMGEVQVTMSLPVLPRGDPPPDEVVRRVQHMLNATGLFGLPQLDEDGDWGSKTKQAVEALQSDRAIPVTGKVDKATWEELLHYWLRPDAFG